MEARTISEVLGANWKLIPQGHPFAAIPLAQRVVREQNLILLTQQEHDELKSQLEALNGGSEA